MECVNCEKYKQGRQDGTCVHYIKNTCPYGYCDTERWNKQQGIIDTLYNVLTELDARECSNNCVVEDLIAVSWNDLCDKGIELFQRLKG